VTVSQQRLPLFGRTVRLAVLSRVAVLLCGYAAVVTVGYELKPLQYRLSHDEVWNLPARWDAGWYLGIARRGYEWRPELEGRQQSIAFFPAFPILMRLGAEVVTTPARLLQAPEMFGNGNTRVTWGGVLVACLAFVAALIQFVRLVASLTQDREVAFRAAVLLSAWPFALYFSAPYSESLFLLASVSATLAIYRHRHLEGVGWGLIAGLCRPNGWALSVGLLALALRNGAPARTRSIIVALAPALGTALFSGYIWRLTGDPVAWVRAQAGWGREFSMLGFVTHRLERISVDGLGGYLANDPTDIVAVASVVGVAIGAIIVGRRIGWGMAVFPIAYLLPAVVIDLPAIGRMTSVVFPSFLGLALVLSKRQAITAAVVFGVLQAWLAGRFFTWHSPF